MNRITVLILSIFMFISASAHSAETPEEFFDKYRKLGEEFDPKVSGLYADSAKIHTYRVYPHGLERNIELTGAQWKELINKVMPIAKSQNDKSSFSEIQVVKIEGGYKIKANRYSIRKCYTDTGYYLIVRPGDAGDLVIFEEYSETKPLSSC